MNDPRGESHRALKNALKLGASLVGTWGIALLVRFLMPRLLGPELFGPVKYANEFSVMCFVLLGLGLDVYIRKEVSVRPELASKFFAGTLGLRLVGALAVFSVMHLYMWRLGHSAEQRTLVHVFGAANLLVIINQSSSALLHAKGTVDGLSFLNVASKVLWAVGVVAALVLHWPLVGIGLAMVSSELVRCVVLFALVRKHLAVRLDFDLGAVKVAIVASLPYYVNTVAQTVYNKLDITLINELASGREVAWYGAATTLGDITLLVSPIIGWVLLPMLARAKARSQAEYEKALRRSLEFVLSIAFPTSLFMALGADLWIHWLFREEYAPAIPALRILAPLFVLTYVTMVLSNALVLIERAWTLTFISLAGLAVNALLVGTLIPAGVRWFGVAGGGMGAAVAQLGTEVFVTAVMAALVGRYALDKRNVVMILKTLLVCGLVVLVDRGLSEHGVLRIAIGVVVYLVLLVATRAVNVREFIEFLRQARRSRGSAAAEV